MMTTNAAVLATNYHFKYDRMSELKAFDETKAGVKGLVDSGIINIPRIFIANEYHPTFNPDKLNTHNNNIDDTDLPNGENETLPIIDFQDLTNNESSRKKVVDEIRRASEEWGFFQVVNHGIPQKVLDKMIEGIRGFHEQETEVKKQYYTRDTSRKFRYMSNLFLHSSRVVNWKDTLYCFVSPSPPNPEDISEVCRYIIFEYAKEVKMLGTTLLELFSEGLGLERDYLKKMNCAEENVLLGHYYPSCPQPELAIGNISHYDGGLFTILLQDQTGGLQVHHNNQWIDATPIHGALIINIADIMQVLTNDKFKSVKHRVVSKQTGPRVSMACLFLAEDRERLYYPIKDILTEGSLPKYQGVSVKDCLTDHEENGLDGTSKLRRYTISKK